jgi:hypothetical protein
MAFIFERVKVEIMEIISLKETQYYDNYIDYSAYHKKKCKISQMKGESDADGNIFFKF